MAQAEVKSMREQLDEAWKSKEVVEEEETEEEVKDEQPEGSGEGDSKDSEGEAGEEPKEGEEPAPKEGEGDDEKPKSGDGEERTDKKEPEAKPTGDSDKKGNGKDEEPLKAPASWKPAVREHWGKLPKDVQAEITRREREIDLGLQNASGFKRLAHEYVSAIRPFENLIRAQNSTPYQAITNLMTTAARLMQGTKQQKAEVIAEILQNYDVDIPTLDQVLSGKVKPGSDPDAKVSTLLEEKLKPVMTFIEEVKGSRAERVKKDEEESNKTFEEFSKDPKNEFFEDVRNDMADLMEMAANRNQPMTLAQAYERACQINTDVAKIISQRRAAATNELDQKKLARKHRAASSIKGNPDEEAGGKRDPSDMRGSILQAMEDLEQR